MSTGVAPHLVTERRAGEGAEVPLWVHPGWVERFPWLVQGITGRGDAGNPFDLGLSGTQPVGRALDRWRALASETRMPSVVHARQVHGADVAVHRGASASGLLVMDAVDGHLARVPRVLVTVSIADCVPVSILDTDHRAVALVHAGWRGVAGAIVERAVARLAQEFGSAAESLWLHCGPAICGLCYEVGPEVHRAVAPERDPPSRPHPIDLRAAIADRAAASGVVHERCTVSTHCTRCTGDGVLADAVDRPFFSHRAGDSARQMAVLGIRDA